MNWILKLLGHRDLKYRGNDFSVRIKPTVREGVSVTYPRRGEGLNLSGERIGRKWEGIEVHIPPEVEAAQATQIVRDLETAFGAMRTAMLSSARSEWMSSPRRSGKPQLLN